MKKAILYLAQRERALDAALAERNTAAMTLLVLVERDPASAPAHIQSLRDQKLRHEAAHTLALLEERDAVREALAEFDQ